VIKRKISRCNQELIEECLAPKTVKRFLMQWNLVLENRKAHYHMFDWTVIQVKKAIL